MKAIILYAAMHGFDHGLNIVIKIISETLKELGVETEETNIALTQIPYYDGIQSKYTESIVQSLKKADGIILGTTAQLFAPCAPMQTFLEHLELESYRTSLAGKNCMLVAVSATSGEKSALDYLGRVVNYLGGYDAVRIGAGGKTQKLIGKSEQFKEIVEKQVEDYYRILRQNRKFIIPQDTIGDVQAFSPAEGFTPEEYETILKADKRPKVTMSDLYQKVSLDGFTKRQEEDINEITQYFAKKYSTPPEEKTEILPAPALSSFGTQNVVPRVKSCKQMTQSLPHYFQPHLANGVTMSLQINVSGAETFDGYIKIDNSECAYADGNAVSPDLTILTDSKVWSDVLKGKHTAQKAFMIGQLKVRGNFVLLSKFEQLFRKM